MRTGPDGEMKMTFQKAWNTLRQQKPGLFNFEQAPVSSKPYAQLLPGVQQPAVLRTATIRAERAIAAGAAYIPVSAEDYEDLLSGKYESLQITLLTNRRSGSAFARYCRVCRSRPWLKF